MDTKRENMDGLAQGEEAVSDIAEVKYIYGL